MTGHGWQSMACHLGKFDKKGLQLAGTDMQGHRPGSEKCFPCPLPCHIPQATVAGGPHPSHLKFSPETGWKKSSTSDSFVHSLGWHFGFESLLCCFLLVYLVGFAFCKSCLELLIK